MWCDDARRVKWMKVNGLKGRVCVWLTVHETSAQQLLLMLKMVEMLLQLMMSLEMETCVDVGEGGGRGKNADLKVRGRGATCTTAMVSQREVLPVMLKMAPQILSPSKTTKAGPGAERMS